MPRVSRRPPPRSAGKVARRAATRASAPAAQARRERLIARRVPRAARRRGTRRTRRRRPFRRPLRPPAAPRARPRGRPRSSAAPSRAVGDRDELAAPTRPRARAGSRSDRSGSHVDRSRRRGVQREERRLARGGEHDVVRHLELAEHGAAAATTGLDGGVRARDDDDLVLPVVGDEDEGDPGRRRRGRARGRRRRSQPRERLLGERVGPRRRRPCEPWRRAARRPRPGSRPCRREPLERGAGDRLSGPRQAFDARDEVEVDRPDDRELDVTCRA